jgi:thiol-disulfide isomerase/thioredoxin
MKAVFPKFVSTIAIFATVAFFQACSGNESAQNGPADEPAQSSSPAPSNTGGPSTTSGYPKLASSVATAEIKGLDGGTYTLNDKVGKVMLVNLWATWCGPCRFEIPALVRMQEKHGPQGFEVLGLNTDDEEAQLINDFSAELKVNYPMAYADTRLQASMLKISKFPGIPQSFLLDRDGRLRGVFRGANPADIRKMEEVVAKVVNESAAPVEEQPVAETRSQ